MLQTVRDYARSRLEPTETADALARHAAYYQALAVKTGEVLRGGGQRRALEALDADIGNIQLAVESLLADSRQQTVADVAWALWLYCWARGALGVWRGWTRAASAGAGALPVRARARLLGADGFLAMWQQDYDTALPELKEALELGRQVEDGSLVTLVDIALVIVHGGHGRRDRRPRGRTGGAPARPGRGRPVERGLRADRDVLPRCRARSVRRPGGRLRRDARCGADLRGPGVPGDRAGKLRRAPAGHRGRRRGGRADRRQPADV